ncbi:hypothetical protein RRG08_022864 [Elysia crispata]|uniref:Uncharacterized protein n=1 Tax=Elysia crispata TaxID=231223 RepID=A0AAE0Z0N3_9GAST|nr:hypothetical protein RRG08_022864 [Elysia crispata]
MEAVTIAKSAYQCRTCNTLDTEGQPACTVQLLLQRIAADDKHLGGGHSSVSERPRHMNCALDRPSVHNLRPGDNPQPKYSTQLSGPSTDRHERCV